MDKQTITGNGGASYTLTHSVANAQEIEVFVNNVRQEPGVAYTVSGTALTMTGNVASTDDFYVIYQGKALQTTVPPDDSVTTARLADDAVTRAKMADDLSGTNLAIDTTSSTFKMTDLSSNAFYRTGTWTVTDVSGDGLSLTQSETARYVRIGDLVYVNFYVTFPTSGGTGITTKLGGLPFPAATGYGYHYLAGRIQDYTAADVRVQIQHGESWGVPQQNNTGMLNSQLAVNLSGVGRYVIMSGCYIAQSGT